MHWIALQPTPEARSQPVVPASDALSAAAVGSGAGAGAPASVPSTPHLADPQAALAWWALQFTPHVAQVEEALLLEVSASERLFGGRAALLRQLLEPNWPLAPVEYAQGATSLVAMAHLRCTPQSVQAQGAAALRAVHALPLYTLSAARPHLPTLARMGIRTWGQLRALPRGGLVRRFGSALVDALDRAYGQRSELYPWLTLPEVFDAPLELAAQVESAPALLFGARRLLAQLQLWLRARQRGVVELELLWELDARRSNAQHIDAHHQGGAQGRLVLRTAQATQDVQHLQRLLGEQLARVNLPAPVLYLRMRSLQTEALASETRSLLPDTQRPGDSLHHMLERLSARLGKEQVLCVQPHADHRPEHMQHWRPWQSLPPKAQAALAQAVNGAATKKEAAHADAMGATAPFAPYFSQYGALHPTWLLLNPLKLPVRANAPQHHGPLALLVGPHRLEAGWLDDTPCALRDYFIARSTHAGLLWIYRERLPTQTPGVPGDDWYLHGVFG